MSGQPTEGGLCRTPRKVWVLTNGHPGNTGQAVGLARALGWPFEIKTVSVSGRARWHKFLPWLPLRLDLGLDLRTSSCLGPPYPDVVIGVGRATAPITRWLGRCGRGRIFTVQLGRGAGADASRYDAVISPSHCQMPPHPRRREILLPLNAVSPRLLAEATESRPDLFADLPRPRVVLLVGGDATRFSLGSGQAETMAREVRQWAEAAGGSVVALTSRRTGKVATAAIEKVLCAPHRVYRWTAERQDNPYLACLALADILVVTGESESMMAEAAATSAPLYIYPVREKRRGALPRWKDRIARRAHAAFTGAPGRSWWRRFGDGLCAFLIARSMLNPARDMQLLHRQLFAAGRARPFGAELETASATPLQETAGAAHWLKTLILAPRDSRHRPHRHRSDLPAPHPFPNQERPL